MLPRLNFMPCLVIGALLIAFWAMVYMPDTACFGAAQEKDANDTELGAPTDMSSDEPNSAVETVAETDQNDVTPVQTSKIRNGSKRTPFWKTPKMIATYVVLGIIVIVAAGWFLLRNTGRTRLGMQRTLSSDEDLAGGEFMIVFNWTQKVLYLPTIIASFLAAMLMYLLAPQVAPKFIDQPVFQTTSQSVPQSEPPLDPQAERSLFGFEVSYRTGTMVELIGGLWLAIFFFNLLIEEYNIRLIVIILSLVSFGFLFLLLNLFQDF